MKINPHPAAASKGNKAPEKFGTSAPDAFRQVGNFGAARLQIASVERSLAFYAGLLGLQVLERGGASAVLGAPEGRPLIELNEVPGARPVPAQGRLGLFHHALLLPGRQHLAAFVRHLEEQGVAAGMSDHGVSEAAYLTDPDGLGVEVYADRPIAAWRNPAGQIRMFTAPLDVADLFASHDQPSWSRMPEGVRIGHLHFSVDDLDLAASFYGEGLGLVRTVEDYPGALFLGAGGYHHHIGLNTWARHAKRPGRGDARLSGWALEMPEGAASTAAARLRAAGFSPRAAGAGWLADDPWGTTVEILALPNGAV